MTDPKNMCWDSCVFIRFLTKTPVEYLDDIEDFIREAQNKKRTIYYSTIALAEIRPSQFKTRGYGHIQDFFEDFAGAFEPINPDPNILAAAAQLRDAIPIHPSHDPKAKKRVIGIADAIHLMTCLYVRDTLDVRDVVFHTFDKGKGEAWEGKCVPLIGFQDWFPNPAPRSPVANVCSLTRIEPAHPQPRLLSGAGR